MLVFPTNELAICWWVSVSIMSSPETYCTSSYAFYCPCIWNSHEPDIWRSDLHYVYYSDCNSWVNWIRCDGLSWFCLVLLVTSYHLRGDIIYVPMAYAHIQIDLLLLYMIYIFMCIFFPWFLHCGLVRLPFYYFGLLFQYLIVSLCAHTPCAMPF